MGATRTSTAQSHMTALGRAEGIEIKYGGRTGNTSLSHQLLHYARSQSLQLQTDVALELFRLHFGEERDITSLETMIDAAGNCGLDVQRVRAYLENGVAKAQVDTEAASLRKEGVKGVPRFRFQNGESEVDGAGDVMEFFEILMGIKGGVDGELG